MRYQFTRSARKHRIGRSASIEAMVEAGAPDEQEDGKLLWIGTDARGRELEIIGVPLPAENLVLIIHVMPTAFRKGN
jgi:hypothetical protein